MIEIFRRHGLVRAEAPSRRVALPIPLTAAEPKSFRQGSESTMIGLPGGGRPYKQKRYKRRVKDLQLLSESALPSRAIRLIRNGICSLEYGCRVKAGAEDRIKDKAAKKSIDLVYSVLDNPNTTDDDLPSFLGPQIEDLLTFDGGVWEYVENPAGMPNNSYLALETVPPFTMAQIATWDGKPASNRWAQVVDSRIYTEFQDQQIEYTMMRKRSWKVFGLSPLETAVDLMDAFLAVGDYQRDIASNGYPPFLLWLGEEADDNQAKEFRVYWENELKGKGTPGFFGGTGKTQPTAIETKPVSDEGLYLKYQEVLIRMLAYAFDLSPMDFGMERDVNRNTAEVQASSSVQQARRPIAQMLAAKINARVLPRIARLASDPVINDLEFFWIGIDPVDEKEQSEILHVYVTDDVKTLDEARAILGDPPLPRNIGSMTISAYRALVATDPTAGMEPEDAADLVPEETDNPADVVPPQDGTIPEGQPPQDSTTKGPNVPSGLPGSSTDPLFP